MSFWFHMSSRIAPLAALAVIGSGCQTSSAASSSDAPANAADQEPAVTQPAHAPAHGHGEHGAEGVGHGAHRGDHFQDPERFVAAWNAPERDAYQKPDEIIAAMGIEPGDTVVDLGAGTGYLIPKLSTAVGPEGAVLAADIEPKMLAFLDDAAKKEGWTNVRTHASAPDDPRLEPGSVNAVVALNVWHHVGEREAYAKKLYDALAPGGRFVVVDFLKEDTEGFGPPMEMRLVAEQVVRELTAGGFETSIIEETMPRHYVVVGVKGSEAKGQ